METEKVKEYVKKRYREIAQAKECCCSASCCQSSTRDIALRIGYSEEDLRTIPDASIMGLGCGNPIALACLKEGEIVLDLGSGGGMDVFLAAEKVGVYGKVIGVDMTKEMISRATATAVTNGYKNVEFRLGEIENLPVRDDSVDVAISNCVINLSLDKQKVFQEVYRVLKKGGRIMISDLVTEGELSEEVRKSFDAWAGCIAGAIEKTEYLNTISKVGFKNISIISERMYDIEVSQELKGRITSIQVAAYKH